MARSQTQTKKIPAAKKTRGEKAKPAPAAHSFSAAPTDFIDAFFDNVLPDDLAAFSTQDKQRIASSIWHLAQQRMPGAVNLRLFNPSPETDGWEVDHTVLEVVNDDMPFLVDSVTGALQQRGLAVHL